MRLSTKGRYGVAAMYELASYYDKSSVSLKDIAKKQNFSEAYMEQLFATLKKEKLIVSQRGAKGGYRLAKPPGSITVGQVIRALEGPIEFSECVGGNDDYQCNRESFCVTKDIWLQVNDSINAVIDNITLQDLLDKYKQGKKE